MSFPTTPWDTLAVKSFSADPGGRSISGTLQKNGVGQSGTQVLVLDTQTLIPLTGTYTNTSGDFLFKDVPLSTESYLVFARKSDEVRPAAKDNLTRNESGLLLEFSAGGAAYPTVPIGARILTLQNGKFVAVSVSPTENPLIWATDAEVVNALMAANTAYAASTTPTITRTTFDTGTTGKALGRSLGAVLASTGIIYGAPVGRTDVISINPTTGTVANSDFGLIIPSSRDSYLGAVLGADGKIYCIPGTADKVLIINPATNTAELTDFGISMPAWSTKWFGGVAADNGKIYCPPWDRAGLEFLVIDTLTGTATLQSFGLTNTSTNAKMLGGTRGLDGKLYFAPFYEGKFVVVDPSNNTAVQTDFGQSLPIGTGLYAGGTIGADGNLYFCPYSAGDVFRVNTATGTGEKLTFGLSLSGSQKWEQFLNGPDGCIYGIPCQASDVLRINPVAGTAVRSSFGASLSDAFKFYSGASGADGKLYGLPGDSSTVMQISFGAVPALPLNVCLHPALNKL